MGNTGSTGVAPTAKDIDKRAAAFFDDKKNGFVVGQEVKLTGRTDNDVSYETKITQTKKGLKGEFKPKYEWKEMGTTFSGEASTAQDFKLDVSVNNKLADGLKAGVTVEHNTSKSLGTFATVSTEYKHEAVTLTDSVNYGKKAGSDLKASAAALHNGLIAGAQLEYFLGEPKNKPTLIDLKLGFVCPQFDLLAFNKYTDDNDGVANVAGLSYFHNVNRDLQLAFQLSMLTGPKPADGSALPGPVLKSGIKWQLDDASSFKGVFETEKSHLRLAYTQAFNRRLTTTLSADLDTRNLSQESTVFGVGLALQD